MSTKAPSRVQQKKREHRRLRVIPPPANGSRSILQLDAPGTILVQGNGGGPAVSYDCGNCGSPLLVDVTEDQVRNVVLKCNNCGSYNESPS